MARIRQGNVLAAQWSPNGSAFGAPDLTGPSSEISAKRLRPDGPAAAATPGRLPRAVEDPCRRQAARHLVGRHSRCRDEEGALERAATHSPTCSSRWPGRGRKRDRFYERPARERRWRACRQGAGPGRPTRRRSRPGASAPGSRHMATRPRTRRAGLIMREPEGHALRPTAFVSWTGEALDRQDPADAIDRRPSKSAVRALDYSARRATKRVLHHSRPRTGGSSDRRRRYYFERARPAHERGRTLFGAKPGRGPHSSTTTASARSRSAILACMLGGRRRERWRSQDPDQRFGTTRSAPARPKIAPISRTRTSAPIAGG